MLATKVQDKNDLNLDNALERMRKYVSKSKNEFSKSLKVQPPSTKGRLAGPAKSK